MVVLPNLEEVLGNLNLVGEVQELMNQMVQEKQCIEGFLILVEAPHKEVLQQGNLLHLVGLEREMAPGSPLATQKSFAQNWGQSFGVLSRAVVPSRRQLGPPAWLAAWWAGLRAGYSQLKKKCRVRLLKQQQWNYARNQWQVSENKKNSTVAGSGVFYKGNHYRLSWLHYLCYNAYVWLMDITIQCIRQKASQSIINRYE